MNAFYERLNRFGLLIQDISQRTGAPLAEWITVVHPGHPIINHRRKVRPMLEFDEQCPADLQQDITKALKKTFSAPV